MDIERVEGKIVEQQQSGFVTMESRTIIKLLEGHLAFVRTTHESSLSCLGLLIVYSLVRAALRKSRSATPVDISRVGCEKL